MRAQTAAKPDVTGLTAKIASAYLQKNEVPADRIPALIEQIHASLSDPEAPAPERPPAPAEAAPDPASGPTSAIRLPKRFGFLLDRTAVLFAGLAVGLTIGLAFMGQGRSAALASAQHGAAKARAASGPPSAMLAADCALPFPPHLMNKVLSGQPISVGVFGDSFGDGMWAALYRRLDKDRFKVLRLSHEGTGFTRYRVSNLEENTANALSGQPVDVAVVVLGANDTEGLADGGHVYPLLSPGWKSVYGARMRRLVSLIRNQGAMVYWVGLPKMRTASYDRDIAALDDFYAEQMSMLNVPFLATRDLSEDERGEFNLYLSDPGAKAPRLMRANDGIHMTMAGYERLAGPLIDRINSYVARAKSLADPTQAAAGPGGSSGPARPAISGPERRS